MALSKKALFGEKEIRLANLAKALSHPARVQILTTLVCSEYSNCCDIADELPLAQSTVSQHLKALKESGLIEMTTDGLKSNYKLSTKQFDKAIALLEGFLTELSELRNNTGASTCKPNSKTKEKC